MKNRMLSLLEHLAKAIRAPRMRSQTAAKFPTERTLILCHLSASTSDSEYGVGRFWNGFGVSKKSFENSNDSTIATNGQRKMIKMAPTLQTAPNKLLANSERYHLSNEEEKGFQILYFVMMMLQISTGKKCRIGSP